MESGLREFAIDIEKLEVLPEERSPGIIESKKHLILIVLIFIGAMGVWEALVVLFDYPQYILPRPSNIALSLWIGLVSKRILWYEIGYTMAEVMLGFFFGAAVGLLLGMWIALSRSAERIFYPYIVALNTLPKVAIAPLFVIWLGMGWPSRVAIAATLGVFPMLVNTFTGIRNTEPELIMFLRSLSATKRQIFTKIQLPNALPFIFAGLDLAIVLSVIGAIVGELVSGTHGLGSVIMQKNFSLDTAGVFAVLVVLGAIGAGLHGIMTLLRKKVIFWSKEETIAGG